MEEEIKVIDEMIEEQEDDHSDKVELLYIDGSDERIALAAWTSSTLEINEERRERVPALVHTLLKSAHWSPFEHNLISFKLIVSNSVHVQMLKHRIGVSYNVESARYRTYRSNKTYIPEDLDDEWKDHLRSMTDSCWKMYHRLILDHEEHGLTKSRAKEIAKFFLPFSTQVEMFVTFNLRSFFHFQDLRNSVHAQKEIRDVAQRMWDLVEETGNFRHAMEAFQLYRSTV